MEVGPRTQTLCDKLIANDPSFTECPLEGFQNVKELETSIGALKQNTTLRTVQITGNRPLRDSPDLMLPLAMAFMNHPNLKEVELSYLDCEEIGPIALAFLQNERLSSLSIEYSTITPTTASHLRRLLKENALVSLNLQRCQVYTDLTQDDPPPQPLDLAGVLASNRSLRELTFSETSVTSETVRDLSRFIRQNQAFEKIRMDTSLFDACSNKSLSEHSVVCAAQGHKSLRSFVMNGTHKDGTIIDDTVIEAIGNLANSVPTLRSINLDSCKMGNKELGLLIAGLSHENSRVEELILDVNALDREDGMARTLANYLRSNFSKLKKLSLEENGLKDDDALLLASALEENETLQHFNLAVNNEIGSKGATRIAHALLTNTSLKHLDLECCGFCDDVVVSLFEMLKTNTSLEWLKVGLISGDGIEALLKSLPLWKGLKHLEIDSEEVSSNLVSDLVNTIEQHNTTLEKLVFIDSDDSVDRSKLDHILQLNRGGRRILKETTVPDSLWPRILARSSDSPNVLFYFLREKPRLCRRPNSVAAGKKRKRDESIS